MTQYSPNSPIQHPQFGSGIVRADVGETVLVKFEHGIEEVVKSSLTQLSTPLQAVAQQEWSPTLEVITRIQAEAIQAINNSWGVFAMSRIALLPHQLWVCKKVTSSWPTRWLVADDVGLGKTIEAGLILSALIAAGKARRILVIVPASLVEQWQLRLRTMFDIRMAIYTSEADTNNTDFWNTHSQVVVSLHTLRIDSNGRHDRLLESDPWDMVLVDESHHLNYDEAQGPTLGYKLLENMVEHQRIQSMVFFSGTPHRGKNFNFLAQLKLLRSDLFTPNERIANQLSSLRQVMIRNNKQNVTDLKGQRLFKAPLVTAETYEYSPAEAKFYSMLTEFIVSGRAYASKLSSSRDSRAVMLVLTAMQKLASSSVAAIGRALQGRLNRREQSAKQLQHLEQQLQRYTEKELFWDTDEVSRLEEEIIEKMAALRLMNDEEPELQALISAAQAVTEETKINKIIELVQFRFTNLPILFFTEYKATQSLLMSALIAKFGKRCVAFINGDDRAEGVIDERGQGCTLYQTRELAAEKFNKGEVRFLISTEAGGEGIDLQERCHILIHVDLPWNPMRLHQRVGRLNRYGQTKQVEVITVRNPDTVESKIWDKLNEKIDNIMLALQEVMDDPEDLLQLVLGMTTPSMFRELFSQAHTMPTDSLAYWFDEQTSQFGGQDALEMVTNLVGQAARFDFQQVSHQIPPLDLPDLRPFFVSMLTLNRRRVDEEADGLTFITPDEWLTELGIYSRYKRMIFNRHDQAKDATQRILGVGHKLIQQALQQAKTFHGTITTLPNHLLPHPLIIFRITDRLTGLGNTIQTMIVGFTVNLQTQSQTLLHDWQLLQSLNQLSDQRGFRKTIPETKPTMTMDIITTTVNHTTHQLEQLLPTLDVPFQMPHITLIALIWPDFKE